MDERGQVVFTLVGRIRANQMVELLALLKSERHARRALFDLSQVELVDSDAILFFALCKVRRATLRNCPHFIRDWIDLEKSPHINVGNDSTEPVESRNSRLISVGPVPYKGREIVLCWSSSAGFHRLRALSASCGAPALDVAPIRSRTRPKARGSGSSVTCGSRSDVCAPDEGNGDPAARRTGPHAEPGHGFRDGFGIIGIVLLGLHIGLNELWGHQTNRMAQPAL